MCGLVGISGDLEFKDEATMKRLLLLDYFRGMDSTGFASVGKTTNDIKVAKLDSHPINLFANKHFDKALAGYGSKVFLGHNRAATIGKVNEYNAHPFKFGEVVGAHNGTLDNASWKRLEAALGVETSTDSMAIFMGIDKLGIDATIELLEEGRTSATGAWALTWFDGRTNTINFLRNTHRPLWYSWTKDFKRLLWASEWPMIENAARMAATNPYELHQSDEGYRFWEFKSNQLYSFDLEEMAKGYVEKPKGIVRTIKGREPAGHVVGSPPFVQHRNHGGHGTTTTQTGMGYTAPKTEKVTPFPDVVDIMGTPASPLAHQITKQQFNQLAHYGCSWCGATVEESDPGVTVYMNQEAVLCGSCSGHDNPRVVRDYETSLDLKIPMMA